MIGKKLRLSKIIHPKTGRTCIVPMDHGITMGPIEGLKDTINSIHSVVNGGADAIILHKGMLNKLTEYPDILSKGNFILHISASTRLSSNEDSKYLVSSVEHALRVGAAGVSVHVNLGTDKEQQMVSDLGVVADACEKWGMPLLAMMYVMENGKNSLEAEKIIHAVRVAEELGADIVKISPPKELEEIQIIKEYADIPVLVSGGPKVSTKELLVYVNNALKYGANGISMGRNIFQADNTFLITTTICKMIHQHLSLEDALNNLNTVIC